MAKAPDIVIKNIRVDPETVQNDGGRGATVSAVVFTPVENARIADVSLDLGFIKRASPLPLLPSPDSFVRETNEGLYTGKLEVPLLTDPGHYDVPITAQDSSGASGVAYARLRVNYQRPRYAERISQPASRAALERISGSAICRGNGATALVSGQEAFDRRLALIQSAQRQINLQSYTLFAEGQCGKLLDAIMARAEQGVQVNMILNMSSQVAVSPMTALRLGLQKVSQDVHGLAREMEEALEGSQGLRKMVKDITDIFNRIGLGPRAVNVIMADELAILGPDEETRALASRSAKWLMKMGQDQKNLDQQMTRKQSEWSIGFKGPSGLPSLPLLSYAVHEKIMVVDGKAAIIGGRNLEDRYFTHWIDKDLYLEGPIVARIQAGFLRNWDMFRRNLQRDMPALALDEQLPKSGDLDLRFVQSRPWLGEYNTLEFLVTAFQMARQRILISTQFIVLPDSLLRDALLDAVSRGVAVHILTNSYNTSQELGFTAGYFISLNYCEPLLDAGIRIYEISGPADEKSPKPYLHTKEFLIDGEWAAIGSFNLSIRSCFIESENLVEVQDASFAAGQEDLFWDLVKNHSTEITRDYFHKQKAEYQTRLTMVRYLDLFY